MSHSVSCGGIETMIAEIENKLTDSLEDMNITMIVTHKEWKKQCCGAASFLCGSGPR
jgi:hypothetical protein